MTEWPEVKDFQEEFREFVAERDWDQFHTPKNLAMALAGEVGELLEHFQWLTAEQSAELPDETRLHGAAGRKRSNRKSPNLDLEIVHEIGSCLRSYAGGIGCPTAMRSARLWRFNSTISPRQI